ncbi:hypothetical protein FCOIX_10722 [Fusarium coicis]|nr:hypothetical protein FCOIX_10722 [Fusarium coicis]
MKILMAAIPEDKDKGIYRAPHSQSSGSGIVPFPVQSNTVLQDIIVARANNGHNLHLQLAKRKRAGSNDTNNPRFVVFEDSKPVPKVAKTDFRLADSLSTTNQENLNRRVKEEVRQQLQKAVNESLREVETALTLETGGASNQEANYRLEGATLLRDRISNTIPSASADEIKKIEDDLRGLYKSRRLILEDMGCIKDSMAAKV